MRETLVVIPTYEERENITLLTEAILGTVPSADVLVVDDGSPDGTADLVENRFRSDCRVSVLRRTGDRGLGLAYHDAFALALARGYERVIQMDADFSHNPRYLPGILRAAETSDVVIGSRYISGGGVWKWGVRRKFMSRMANSYLHICTGLPVADATSGYRCYSHYSLGRIGFERIFSRGFAFQVEMTWRAVQEGLVITELPIIFVDRSRGHSKMTAPVIAEMAILPFRLRSGTLIDRKGH
jgi:dolichol-phosphate mannosyltransferase